MGTNEFSIDKETRVSRTQSYSKLYKPRNAPFEWHYAREGIGVLWGMPEDLTIMLHFPVYVHPPSTSASEADSSISNGIYQEMATSQSD